MSRLRAFKQSVKSLQASERHLRQQARMLELAPVLVRDPHDCIIYWNQGIECLYGFSKEEALGRVSHELLQTQCPEPLDAILARLHAGREWRGELRQRRRDGTWLFIHSVWRPQLDPAGHLTAIIQADSDITERKRAEVDRARLAAIVDSSEDAIISKTLDGIIVSWNASAERLFGYRAEEIIGQPITTLIPPELQAEETVILGRLRRGEHIKHYETVRVAKDGHRLELALTISPVRDSSGRIIGASKTAHDISQRKRAERALQAAMDQLGQINDELELRVQQRTARLRETVDDLEAFSYTLSHDLRASVRAVRGLSQLVLAEGEGKLEPAIAEQLQKVVHVSQGMDRLIHDVLALSRAGRQDLTFAPVDVERLVRQLVSEQPDLQPPRAEVTIESPLLPVLGHELSLSQCLTNLLGNAVKYVAPRVQPRIRIWTESVDSGELIVDRPAGGRPAPTAPDYQPSTIDHQLVRVFVQDNGIGIPPEAQERIFDIFHRLHSPEQYEGTGIGLAIVRKAVTRMGGQVGVESAPGQGSRFWLELPGV